MAMICNGIYRSKAAVNKIVEFEEIAWRITAYSKFGKHHELGSGFTGLIKGMNDLRRIRFEVPYMIVDLGKRYFHALKLKNNPDFQGKIICECFVIDSRILRILAVQDVHETIVEGNAGKKGGAAPKVKIYSGTNDQ